MVASTRPKQVTTAISEEIYVKLHAAKLFARKPLHVLIAEGCALVAEQHRVRRATERITGAAPIDSLLRPETGGPIRKVTAELPDDLYLSLWAAKHHAKRPLKALVADGCAQIAEHYWELRRAARESAKSDNAGVSQ